MATYEQYMNAARNADAAGDEAAARQLVQAARALQSEQPAQPEISTTEDVARSLGSGMVRGAIGLAETPEMAGRAIKRGYQEVKQRLGGEVDQLTPIFDTATGRVLREATTLEEYQPQTTAGEYAGTVGEFLPAAIGGPAGLARRAGVAVTAGLGSEAAGQATEGTDLEPYARITGALVAPYAANRTLSVLQAKNAKSPTIASLKAEKTTAYNMLKEKGTGLTATETAYLTDEMKNVLNLDDIVLSAKPSVERALKLVNEVEDAGAMNLAKFNELQKALGKIYRSAPDAPEVLSMMTKMDSALANKATDKDLLLAAKAANKKYSKARMLDKYFNNAMEGAGKGRIISNAGEALQNTATRILRNDKNKAFWSDDELRALQALSQGSVPTRVMGALGKLSPTSGGLMTGLNMAIAFASPYNALEIIGMTATTFAKLGYNAKVKKSRKALEDLVRAGGVKEPSKVITRELVEDMVARIGGLTAMETQGQ
jgi:hypothetical protein